jgi:large conductance mechanosensitive channel
MAAADDEILEELRAIRKALTPAPPPPPPKGIWNEFRSFLDQYKVLGLAVGFIMGIYLGNLAKALVTDLVLPIIAFVLPPGSNVNQMMIGPFGVGDFANNLLTFIIIAVVIFLIVKAANKARIK